MNILHHKSWHVRTKKNIEKVRKDEQRALEEQAEKLRKADIAEQERRIQQLRNKFNVNQSVDQTVDCVDRSNVASTSRTKQKIEPADNGHLNLFQQEYESSKNKAHELEKKNEQEQWERKVGILNYLGGNKQADVPWYERPPDQDHNKTVKSNREISILEYHDPLNKIKKELKKRKEDEANDNFKRNKFPNRRAPNRSFKYPRDVRREPQADRNDRNDSQLETKTELSEKELKLKELRDKRLKREAKESKKSKDLVNKNRFNGVNEEMRGRPYFNQYNPQLARN